MKRYFTNWFNCLILIFVFTALWIKEMFMVLCTAILDDGSFLCNAMDDIKKLGDKYTKLLNETDVKVLSDDEADDWVE